MRRSQKIGAVAVAVLFVSASAFADCVSVFRDATSGVSTRAATAVAWAGNALGVAKIDLNSYALYFATYSEDLQPITADRVVADRVFAQPIALLWTGSEFGLFYQAPVSSQLMLQRLTASGASIGSPVQILPNHNATSDRQYDVIWDAGRGAYLIANSVTRGPDGGIWLSTINPDGTTRGERFISYMLDLPSQPRVAVGSNGTPTVIFRGNSVLQSSTVAADGSIVFNERLMNATNARIASDGSSFLVVGVGQLATPPLNELHWAELDATGHMQHSEQLLLTGTGQEVAPVFLYWNAALHEWALSYLDSLFGFDKIDGQYRLARFTTPDTFISDSPFIPSNLMSSYGTTLPFAWSGTSYLSSGGQPPTSGRQGISVLMRNCPLTSSINASTSTILAGQSITFTGAASGGAPDFTFTWDFGDGVRNETGQTLTHKYNKLGDYTVQLVVKDISGATSTSTTAVHVVTTLPPPPPPPPPTVPVKRRAVKRG